jgi:hypothetical protein
LQCVPIWNIGSNVILLFDALSHHQIVGYNCQSSTESLQTKHDQSATKLKHIYKSELTDLEIIHRSKAIIKHEGTPTNSGFVSAYPALNASHMSAPLIGALLISGYVSHPFR